MGSAPRSVPRSSADGILTSQGDYIYIEGNTVSKMAPDGSVTVYGRLDTNRNTVYMSDGEFPKLNIMDDSTILLYEEAGMGPGIFKRQAPVV